VVIFRQVRWPVVEFARLLSHVVHIQEEGLGKYSICQETNALK